MFFHAGSIVCVCDDPTVSSRVRQEAGPTLKATRRRLSSLLTSFPREFTLADPHVASASSSGVGTMMTLASGRAGPRLGATSLTQPLSGTLGNFITTTRFSYATKPSAGPHTHVCLYFLYHDISSMTYASRLQDTAHFCALLPSACNRESPCAAIDTTHPFIPQRSIYTCTRDPLNLFSFFLTDSCWRHHKHALALSPTHPTYADANSRGRLIQARSTGRGAVRSLRLTRKGV